MGQQARVGVCGTGHLVYYRYPRDATGRRRRANGSALTRRAVGAHVGASIYPTCYDYRISAQPIAIRDGFGALQIGFENSDPGPPAGDRGRRADRDGRGGEQATRRASSHLVTPHAPSLKLRFAIRVGASLTVTADRLFFLTRRAAAAPQRSALLIVSMKATRHARGDHTDINCIFTILSTAPLARCGTRTRGRVCTMRHYEV